MSLYDFVVGVIGPVSNPMKLFLRIQRIVIYDSSFKEEEHRFTCQTTASSSHPNLVLKEIDSLNE